jgi:hypothetical protein
MGKRMWRLIRKNSLMFLLYLSLYWLFLLITLQGGEFFESPRELLVTLGFYMFWLILGGIWSQEQLEEKQRGYRFLQILPIRPIEIVGAKYVMAFLAVLAYLASHLVGFFFMTRNADEFLAGFSTLVVFASACLVMAGIYYLGFFRFGYHRFSKVAIAIWLLLVVSPLPLMIVLKSRFGIGSDEILEAVSGLNPLPVAAIALVLYAGTIRLAARARTGRAE